MTGYPIRAVARLTGISLDSLRAWERRYGAIRPNRGERGRVYTEEDVERLRLLRELTAKGHGIGQIASLSDEELRELIGRSKALEVAPSKISPGAFGPEPPDLGGALSAIERYDYLEADRELSRLATLLSPRELVQQVVVPLMRSVGDRWHGGALSVAQEHMASAVLRNLLGSLVRVHAKTNPSSLLVFATPSGELHEFGLLGAAMLAAGGGLGIVYLGSDLPAKDILSAAGAVSARAIVLAVRGATGWEKVLREVRAVAEELPANTELWVGGAMPDDIARALEAMRAVVIRDFGVVEQHFARLGARL